MGVGLLRVVSLCLALLTGIPACATAARGDEAAEKAKVAKVVRTSIEWAMTKDKQALFDCFARDSGLFFFQPDSKSTMEGFQPFQEETESFFMDPRFKAVGSAFTDLRIHLSKSGDVAWYSCLLTDHNTWDGRPANWDDVRWTGVLEKRQGRWVIVQMHFSMASDLVEATVRGGASFAACDGPYLGQKPPGGAPELFAPGLVCTGMGERDVAITPDGREIYFGVMSGPVNTIMVTRLENGHWTEPAVAPFAADPGYFHFEPCLSADGKRMLFLTTRPTGGEETKPGWANQNIFAADRKEDGTWGEPYDLGAPVNTTSSEFFPSLTRDGTLYFTRGAPRGGQLQIVRSRLAGGRYQEPDTLPAAVNGQGVPYNAFVSPDESYLIACVDGRTDGAEPGRPQYFVFFRDPADRWSDGVCLGKDVSPVGGNAGSSYVSPDGKYLFFGSTKPRGISSTPGNPLSLRALREAYSRTRNGNSDIYWMEASFLDTLRPARKE
jgi:ketosteroid isomerase-like protein